jgi:hypothetical protein
VENSAEKGNIFNRLFNALWAFGRNPSYHLKAIISGLYSS